MTLDIFNDVANDAESTQKSTITSYSLVNQLGELINRILHVPGSRLLMARLRERMLNRSTSLAMSTCVLEALPGKLDIKKHSHNILYLRCI